MNSKSLGFNEVSIVLPTHNRASSLEASIPSIINQSYSNWELIVVDDGSNDNTKGILNTFIQQDNRIRCYYNRSRQGQQRSKNRGIALSRYSLILIAEDDVIFDKYCLETLITTYEQLVSSKKGLCFGAIGPRLIENNYVDHDTTVAINKFTGYIYTNFSFDIGRLIEVPTLHSCSLLNKDVFKKVGGFDEALYKGFAYREETDLYYRAKKNGYHLFFQPRAVAYHMHSPTGGSHRGASRFKYGYYFLRNHILFLTRFYKVKLPLMVPAFFLFSVFILKMPSKKPRW